MLDVPNQTAHILHLLKDLRGNYAVFRIKRSTQLKKLIFASCDKKSAELDKMRFVQNGRLGRPNLTPDEHEMENGDVIHAFPGLRG